MEKDIKEKRKALKGKHYDYLFQVIKFLQSQNLTKYAFFKLRDQAINDIYEAQENGLPADKVYKKGHEQHFQKKCDKLPKMGVLEQIANVIMVFFVLFSALSIFVYIYRFIVKVDTFYSEGINLYVDLENLRNMLVYGFLGAVISVFLQKIEKKKQYTQAGIIAVLGIVCVMLTIGLSTIITGNLTLNMLIIIPVFLALSVAGYFINDILSKKKYKKLDNNIEEDKN